MKILSGVLILSLMLAETTLGDIQKRVVGGNTCSPTERRYHVRLTAKTPTNGLEKVCGGSLITNRWLLTAARCWPAGPEWKMYAEVGGHPGPVKPQVEIKQKMIRKDKKGKTHDIMLLQLPTPVPGAIPGPGVDPIPLGDLHPTVTLSAWTHEGWYSIKCVSLTSHWTIHNMPFN
uniref:Peptidase S1 domain-containing protein n=1 Tax=Oncorhynchus kisutch TaxID=8019 RepID=A0A8C7K5T3_ONCKI